MSGNYLGYLLGFVLFVSCSHEQDKKQRTSSINLRQQYVKTNKFLDVDMSKFLPGTQTQASVTAEDSAQMFVALYCFYSHVKEQGKKVTISEITPEYLNSLLENK